MMTEFQIVYQDIEDLGIFEGLAGSYSYLPDDSLEQFTHSKCSSKPILNWTLVDNLVNKS